MLDLPRVREYGRSTEDTSAVHETIQLESIQASNPQEWNELINRRPEGTVFHRYGWLAAIEQAFPYEPRHIEVRKDGNLIGVLPQFGMALPKVPLLQIRSIYPGFGGPVIGTDRKPVLTAMITATSDLCGGKRVLHEIRGCNPELLRYHDHFHRAGYRPARYKARFVLNLDRPYEEILDGMHRSRRRGIEKGRETDHEIVEEPLDSTVVDRLHHVHVEHMNDVDGEALPKSFFSALSEMEEHILILSLYLRGQYAGSLVELLDESRNTVHGFIAALSPELYEHNVSELMYDEVIRWSQENGFSTYDFGGAGGDFENGIFQFKQGFGGRLAPNFYWERGFGPMWPFLRIARSHYVRRVATR